MIFTALSKIKKTEKEKGQSQKENGTEPKGKQTALNSLGGLAARDSGNG